MQPQTVDEARRARMAALYSRTHGPAPDCYRARAEWWRQHAEESANPSDPLRYADGLDRLASDMEARPEYYRRKFAGFTDWQWFSRDADAAPRRNESPADRSQRGSSSR